MGDLTVKSLSLTLVHSGEMNKHLILSQDPAHAIPTAVLRRGCSSKCCKSPGSVIAESLISDLQPAGCLPCSRMSYFCPAELWRQGQDKDRVTAGLGVLLLGLSLLAGTASAGDASSFAASVLFCVSLVSPQVTLLPLLWQPGGFMSKKLLQGNGKSFCFPHLGSFSCSCMSGNTAQRSSIPTPCPHYPARQTTKWQREVKSRRALSTKSLLKIPGKLISFSPCSAFATFFFSP